MMGEGEENGCRQMQVSCGFSDDKKKSSYPMAFVFLCGVGDESFADK